MAAAIGGRGRAPGDDAAGFAGASAAACSSAGCRCRRGELDGPYLYLAFYGGGRNRSLYVPAALEAVVDEHLAVTARNQAALEQVARINVELLARRALR